MTSLDECSEPIESFRTWFLENGGELHSDIHFTRGEFIFSTSDQERISNKQTLKRLIRALRLYASRSAIRYDRGILPLFFGDHVGDCSRTTAIFRFTQYRCASPTIRETAYLRIYLFALDFLGGRGKKVIYSLPFPSNIASFEIPRHLLRHRPYIDVLPRPETLLTPLYFSEAELNLFRGTNLYGATSDQRTTWDAEWQDLCSVVRQRNPEVANRLTRDMYLSSATYLSSRAFPSTLLSSNPSLVATPSSYPVLLPGVDSLNHARNQPVTWSVSRISRPPSISAPEGADVDHCVALTLNSSSAAGEELFNNYGPKPNASLILGYGFALEDNPDDTIMLKIGTGAAASSDEKFTRSEFEIGRDAQGVDALWSEVRAKIAASYDIPEPYSYAEAEESWEEEDIRLIMETADTLSGMATSLLHRLPSLAETTEEVPSLTIRESVRTMWRYYVRGQADILEALLAWLDKKDQEAVRKAQEAGIDIQVEDDDEG